MTGLVTLGWLVAPVWLMALLAGQGAPGFDSAAIERAKTVSTRVLDGTLAAEPFEGWFGRQVGPGGRVEWAVSDCGEQTGSPADAGRDLPVCADAVGIRPDGIRVTVQVRVGSEVTGLTGPIRVYWAYVEEPGRSLQEIDALRNLGATLAAWTRRGVPQPGAGDGGGAPRWMALIEFPVERSRPAMTFPLGRDIVLHVVQALDARGTPLGWDLRVVDRRLPGSPNFFYDCLCGHGPRPHDYYAWHFVEQQYSSERILPVYGYPIAVRVTCDACQVAGQGGEARFTSGMLAIAWQRLPVSNPRQTRVAGRREIEK